MNELHAHAGSGLTLYAVLLDANGKAWYGAAFETISGAAWASYGIALTEAAAGIYLATMPAVATGVYSYVVYERAGGSPATSDAQRGSGWLAWDGSGEITPASAATAAAILEDTGATLPALIGGLEGATVTVVAAVDGGVITIYQAVTLSGTISGLTIPATWTAIYLTIKASTQQADTDARVQCLVSNPGAGTDGLQRLNGAIGTAAQGLLTVDQGAGTVTIWLADDATAALALAAGLVWSAKALKSNGDSVLLAVGTCDVLGQATGAVV